ncbi:MAG: hypothetical protein N3F67_02415 [Acidilobaceae archaeon]|nr:hypothetical protein [Acidilobaceae archaeon]
MPQLLKAIAVAKPQRESWLTEELYDLLLPLDEEARVERSSFRDVLLVISARLSAAQISAAALRQEFSFMARLVPALLIVKASRSEEVLEAIRRVAPRGPVRLMVSLRGRGKGVASEEAIAGSLRSAGVQLDRRAAEAIAVESVDELFVISYGITRKCGLSCTLLVITGPSAF